MFSLGSYFRSSRSIAIRYLFTKKLNLGSSFATYSNILRKASYDPFEIVKCNAFLSTRAFCSSTSKDKGPESEKAVNLSYKEQLKRVVKDYGATVVIFHIAISLTSFGICYLAVSNGVDVPRILNLLPFLETSVSNAFVTGSSTVVISYAVHKMFAPVRISITLTATPFIVKYLRKIGFLKLKNVPKP